MISRHGGQILVDQLRIQGIERVFSVPGESFLAALDGLVDSGIENTVCRHEGGVSIMAEAHAKLTGAPGIGFVTRGPGATNASCGLHIAMQDSTPMILFVGQIPRDHRDRHAFQEVNYRQFFGGLVKWVAEIDQIERLPEYIARAFSIAQSGRSGPVVLALPEDMLSAVAKVPDRPPVKIASPQASSEDVRHAAEKLQQAHTPLVIAGGAGWSSENARLLKEVAQSFDLPVAACFRRQDYMDNECIQYVGDLGVGMNPALAERVRQADCLLVLGAQLGDIATAGYTLIDPQTHDKALLHVHPDPNEPGQVYQTDFPIVATVSSFLSHLTKLSPESATPQRTQWRKSARETYENWQKPLATPGAVKLEQIITWISKNLPSNSIITNGAGNYAAFHHRYYRFKEFGTQLAPTSGSMGYGLPAAIAAKLQCPDRPVVCLAGDGCLQMTLNELSTAMQYDVSIIVIVVNNGKYGTIRMHQEQTYPHRISGTNLANPDFVALVQAYGGIGFRVNKTSEFAKAFEQAQDAHALTLIELVLDDEVLSTAQSISDIRANS